MPKKTSIEKAGSLFDQLMLEMLQKGIPLFDEDGNETGQYRRPNHNELAIILRRLAACSVTTTPATTNTMGEVIAGLAKKGWTNTEPLKMPPANNGPEADVG